MRIGRAMAAALLLVAAACSRRDAPAVPPERFLPAETPMAVVVPSLREAQSQLAPLVTTVLSFPAASGVGETLRAVRDQLGFDPLDPRGAESAGLDPARGAALALGAGAPPLLVLPVGDPKRLEALVARLARDRLGAGRRDELEVEGRKVLVFTVREGAPVALALHVARGTALLSSGPQGALRVSTAAGRAETGSLGADPAFRRARSALGPGAVALVFAPPGSPATAPYPLARDGAAVSVAGSASRLEVRAALLLPPPRLAYWREALAGGGQAAREAVASLPREAFLAGRYDGDGATVGRRLLYLLPAAAEALRRTGLDPDRDVLDLLAPGGAVAMALAPTFQVAAVSRATALGAQDPFRLVQLSAVLAVKDATRAAALLDRLSRSRPPGFAVAARRGGTRRAWSVSHGGVQLDLALDGTRLLVGGGQGVLDALLARKPPEGYVAPTDAARAALAGGAGAAVLDFGQLVASFRSLPPEAYGTGPDAFVMRSLAERVIDPASRLLAGSIQLELAADAALFHVLLEARPPEGNAR